MVNYNYLRYFSVLAQLEHYTLAAARLEISQPSLSSAIRNLEDELGVRLFEKAGRNIRLTEEGRYFQKKVDSAMGELAEATEALQSSRDNAPIVIRLGVISGALTGVVAEEIADSMKKSDRCRHQRLFRSASPGPCRLSQCRPQGGGCVAGAGQL